MAAIALPAYMLPLSGMAKIGLMFEHGNSIAAAFVLFVLGIGVNVGLVLWAISAFGWKRALSWFGLLTIATISIGYIGEHALYREGIAETPHTHAFDDISAPFASMQGVTVNFDVVKNKLMEKIDALEVVALASLVLFILVGSIERAIRKRWNVDAFLTQQAPISDKPQALWNRQIPGFALGVIILLGLVVLSVVGAYVYYPPSDQVFKDMHALDAELFSAMAGNPNKEEAIRRIEEWDLLARKLQVGVFIRQGLTDEQAKAAEDLRKRLEEMPTCCGTSLLTRRKKRSKPRLWCAGMDR